MEEFDDRMKKLFDEVDEFIEERYGGMYACTRIVPKGAKQPTRRRTGFLT
jgi:hypothetical protein